MGKIKTYREVATVGLNTLDDSVRLSPGESPLMLNMDIRRKGRVQTRKGTKYEQICN